MKKFAVLMTVLTIGLLAFSAFADETNQPGETGQTATDPQGLTVFHAGEFDDDGPGAPRSGDGISDGSGWNEIDNPNSAPNSGDGIPDGSGWEDFVVVILPLI